MSKKNFAFVVLPDGVGLGETNSPQIPKRIKMAGNCASHGRKYLAVERERLSKITRELIRERLVSQ